MKRAKEYAEYEGIKMQRDMEKMDKKIDKNTRGTEEKIEKLEDFLLQKL